MANYHQEVKSQIQLILNETFEIEMDQLQSDDMKFEDLGLDSLDVADLIIALQQKTGQKIEITEFLNVKTMSDVYIVASKYSSESGLASPTL